jgi:hypothetical protein
VRRHWKWPWLDPAAALAVAEDAAGAVVRAGEEEAECLEAEAACRAQLLGRLASPTCRARAPRLTARRRVVLRCRVHRTAAETAACNVRPCPALALPCLVPIVPQAVCGQRCLLTAAVVVDPVVPISEAAEPARVPAATACRASAARARRRAREAAADQAGPVLNFPAAVAPAAATAPSSAAIPAGNVRNLERAPAAIDLELEADQPQAALALPAVGLIPAPTRAQLPAAVDLAHAPAALLRVTSATF